MNSLINCCKSVPKVTLSILRSGCFTREYAVLADYNIKWVRPKKLPLHSKERSGDLGLDVNFNVNEIAFLYQKSKELNDADELTRRMFTLQFQPRKELYSLRKEKIVGMVKRHNLDWGSAESTIARMTSQIYKLQEHSEKNPRCKRTRVLLKELIDKRKKFLKYLRTWDYRRFEWLLEKLNLVYKPVPQPLTGVYRKDSLRKLTQNYCDKIVKNKLDAYKTELKEQQKIFFKEKLEKLIFIRNEELSLGLEPSVTEEDIENTRRKVEEVSQQQ